MCVDTDVEVEVVAAAQKHDFEVKVAFGKKWLSRFARPEENHPEVHRRGQRVKKLCRHLCQQQLETSARSQILKVISSLYFVFCFYTSLSNFNEDSLLIKYRHLPNLLPNFSGFR